MFVKIFQVSADEVMGKWVSKVNLSSFQLKNLLQNILTSQLCLHTLMLS